MTETMQITVDGMTYHVGVKYESLKRTATLFEGQNGGLAIAGNTIRDVKGTIYEYEMTINALPNYQDDYDSLYDVLTAPVDYHSVALPYGQSVLEFDAMIESVNDTFYGNDNGTNIWDQMTVTYTPIKPQRGA